MQGTSMQYKGLPCSAGDFHAVLQGASMPGFHLEKNVWGGSSGKCRAKCFEVN